MNRNLSRRVRAGLAPGKRAYADGPAVTVLDAAEAAISRLASLPLAERQREKPALWERATALFDGAQTAGRPMDSREDELYNALTGAIEEISRVEEQERQHRANLAAMTVVNRAGAPAPGGYGGGAGGRAWETAEYRAAFIAYLRGGMAELDPDQRRTLRGGVAMIDGAEMRAQSTTVGVGGYTIPTTFMAVLEETMKKYVVFVSGVTAEVLRTDSGEPITWPGVDDTANSAAQLSEAAAVPDGTDITFTLNTLTSYMQATGWIKASIQLLQDSGIDIEAVIARLLGQRLGRRLAAAYTTGTGVTQPQGAVVGSSLGKTAAGATVVTYAELIDLEHALDPAYREGGAARYMFHDTTLAALRKLVDSQQRPLWVPWLGAGIAGSVPATFNGYGYTVNNSMPLVATGQKSILFGDFPEAFKIREVGNPSLFRADELFSGNLQVGFQLFHRVDSRVVVSAALKHLIQA